MHTTRRGYGHRRHGTDFGSLLTPMSVSGLDSPFVLKGNDFEQRSETLFVLDEFIWHLKFRVTPCLEKPGTASVPPRFFRTIDIIVTILMILKNFTQEKSSRETLRLVTNRSNVEGVE